MLEKEQYVPWQKASHRLLRRQPLRAYEYEPDLDRRSQAHAVSRRDDQHACCRGYAGTMGYASAGVMADFVVVNMVAEAASGIEDAARMPRREAQKRAERYYKV